MTYFIRECTQADAEAIWHLNTQEMGYAFPLEQTSFKLQQILRQKTDKLFVAVAGSQVVGYVHANDYDVIYAPHMKNIMGIAVFSEYKHNGIGKALLTSVENWAKQTGASGVRLVSGANRVDAHAFYKKCGYSGDKQQINFKKAL